MNKKWYLENCKQDALQYKTRTEWARNSVGAYGAAITHGWIKECCSHMPTPKVWSLEDCKRDALKYISKSHWENNSPSAYKKARSKKWLDICCSHMKESQKPNGYWALERCIEEAKKYNTIGEWQKKSASSYGKASSRGWLDLCNSHISRATKPPNYWTYERCKEEALKYSSKVEWQQKSNSSYLTATRNKWAKEISGHMKRPKHHNLKWTKDACIEDAKQYSSRVEWKRSNNSSYSVAYKNKWDVECCSHMKTFGGSSSMEKELANEISKKFNIITNKRFTNKDPSFFAKSFELDIYIPNLNKAIEFDGRYWHSLNGLKKSHPTWPVEFLEKYHEIKDRFFISKNISVLHIKEENWRKDQHQEISKVLEFLSEGN